jgi:nucleotide-binding universal stress UspA family protein
MARGNIAAPFRRAVVGLNGGPTDELVVQMACQLAKPLNAEIVAIHVVEVDWTHDLSDDIGREEAMNILDRAEEIAGQHKMRIQSELLQARDVGAALVDEAVELQADALFIGLPYRKRFGGDFALGTTVPYVLQNAPGQVMVVREAMATSAERGSTAIHPFEAGATSRSAR